MKIARHWSRGVLAALLLSSVSAPLPAQLAETEYEGAAAIGLALRQLGTTKRVLMIAAHPDDETTQVLSTLALGQGATVAYLSLTRGEGGQNGIGLEMQEGLGLIRSEELMAARRLDGAQQFFTRAIDWGFSKNSDEAFTQWPREDLLRDVVAVVRHFRPDVVVSVFSGTPRDGHGQHQAAGIMAREAFVAAADAHRFPDQLAAGLRVHAPIHLYQIVRGVGESQVVEFPTGTFDPLLGRSHFQIAMASRSRHRSQDMGRELTPGPQATALALVETRTPNVSHSGIFAGVDTTLHSHAAGVGIAEVQNLLVRYEATIDDLRRSFNPLYPDRIVPFLVELGRVLDRALLVARAGPASAADVVFHLERERERLSNALLRASLIRVEALSEAETVVPGQAFELEVRIWNGGFRPLELATMEPLLPAGWSAEPRDSLPATLEEGEIARRRFVVTVAPDAEPSEPYFLRLPREGERYSWPAEMGGVGMAFQPDEVSFTTLFRIQGVEVDVTAPAEYGAVDLKRGEYRRPVRVVPAVSLSTEPRLVVVPLARKAEPLHVAIRLVAEEPGGVGGTLRLDAPAGWSVQPSEVRVDFAQAKEQRTIEFTARPPADPDPARATLTAVFSDDRGRAFERGYHLVDYEHIRPRPLYRPATVDLQFVDVVAPLDLRIGYIAGPGDDIPNLLAQVGVVVETLDAVELATAPLEDFDVIVVGIRAYDGRPDLVTHNQRLLDYVRRGGTAIVQYNRYEYTVPGLAPYPLEIARPHDRVTDPDAEIRVLEPDHPVFNTPNRITSSDFEGWVQERGLYFLGSWDERYTPLLEMSDPGEAPNRGSMVVTRFGEGMYVYTGLALFRQLPAGVPGAYRLFANLLALGAI